MRRRKLRWVAVVGLAVTLALLVVCAFVPWPRPDRVTYENFLRIHAGMPLEDINDLVGAPPGDYRTGPVVGADLERGLYWEDPEQWMPDPCTALPTYKWQTDRAELTLSFLRSGQVAVGTFTPVRRQKLGPLDNPLWHVKRQWRRWFP